MQYFINQPISKKAIADLREAVGWNRMEKEYSSPGFHSYDYIAAYDEGLLIGYIGCVSNGVTDAYIQDLMVHPNFQRQGIGTELMNRMIAVLKEQRIFMISVIFEEKLQPFYDRFGFSFMRAGQIQTYESE